METESSLLQTQTMEAYNVENLTFNKRLTGFSTNKYTENS